MGKPPGVERERWERRVELERDGGFITRIIRQGQACESNCRWFHYKICFHPRGYGNKTIVPFQLLMQCWKPLATYALLLCVYVLQYVTVYGKRNNSPQKLQKSRLK